MKKRGPAAAGPPACGHGKQHAPPAWADAHATGAPIKYAGKESEHPDAARGTHPRTGWRPCVGSADPGTPGEIGHGCGGLAAHRRGIV